MKGPLKSDTRSSRITHQPVREGDASRRGSYRTNYRAQKISILKRKS